MNRKQTIGFLGYGEIGSTMGKIAQEAGFETLVRELKYDQLEGKQIDYLHISVPEVSKSDFTKLAIKTIKKFSPKLTVINSSTTPGVTKLIYKKTGRPIVHSPVIGLHPHLYDSVKNVFPKIIGPVNKKSLELAKKHFKALGLKYEIYRSSDESEAAKLLDLVYYAWNIVFCKWAARFCKDKKLSFNDVYIKHNTIYNTGYSGLLPNVVRPIMIPYPGPIGGHCTIPDTMMINNYYRNSLTEYILDQNSKYASEVGDVKKARQGFIRQRDKLLKK